MIRLLLLLPLVLAACGPTTATTAVNSAAPIAASAADTLGAPAPVTMADKTVLDEQAMLSAELAYKAARMAVETGVDAGFIKGATATRFATLDNRAYAALGVVRGAYRAGERLQLPKRAHRSPNGDFGPAHPHRKGSVMNLATMLKALPIVGPIAAKAPEFIELWNEAAAALHPKDQETAKAALDDVQAGNDEGHRRLQEKLRKAAG